MLAVLIALAFGGAPARPAITFWTDAPSGHAEVWAMNEDGTGRTRLTNLYSAKRGNWSPDRRRLVFDGRFYRTLFDFDIGVMNADGTGVQRITRGPERDIFASWSPDGRWIVFTRLKEERGIPDLWLVRPNGTGAHLFARSGSSPSWSPGGSRIGFDSPGGVWTVSVDGKERRKFASGELSELSWSPDGRRLAYTSRQHGQPEVYVANADGTRAQRLWRNRVEDFGPTWSPDGTRILYTHGTDEAHQVYVMNADGSAKTNLSRNRNDEWATSWR
jgi:TolB protein